jgi:glycosyltransferase involved in cell wall biosynthesis
LLTRRYALIIPALNEAEAIGELLRQIPRELFCRVIVVDNGSRDATASVARAAGAEVIVEPRRGYGRACLAGLGALQPETSAVVFMDADLSDDPRDLPRLMRRFEEGRLDLVIGSRVLGNSEPGSLTPLQRFGNWLATHLIRRLWGVAYTDLGPLRMISREALGRMDLADPDFGWNVEMQAKAASLRLKVAEVPVQYRRRRFGKSKISGTVLNSLRAGIKILWTLYRCRRARTEDGKAAAPLEV